MYPSELGYSEQHEWARIEGDRATVGITHFAQEQLGDIVYVDLPEPGAKVTAGGTIGEVESTKSVSDLYSPVTGTVVERNADLEEHPERINSSPYADGWLIVVALAEGDPPQLLDADAYAALVAAQ